MNKPRFGVPLYLLYGLSDNGRPNIATPGCLVCLWAVLAVGIQASEIEVPKPGSNPTDAKCVVSGLSSEFVAQFRDQSPKAKQWREWFSVHVVEDGQASETAINGKYLVADGKVTFVPRFPFLAGVDYQVRVQVPGEKQKLASFKFKRPVTKPTTVLQVYPSADSIHENHLRFYIQFSQSVSRGSVYDHIELRDEKGNIVDSPFLRLDEELWDRQQKRLTLLFDPGRVKRELVPREELGSAILAGHTYTLHVLDSLKDANGNPVASYKKQYKILAPDMTQPNQKRWAVIPPTPPNGSLIIRFNEALDWGLLNRVVTVVDDEGQKVKGQVAVGKHERSWSFQPAARWEPGRYEILIDTRLEDPSGNSIGRPFEVDILRPVEKRVAAKVVSLSFSVR